MIIVLTSTYRYKLVTFQKKTASRSKTARNAATHKPKRQNFSQ
jgi:hypothetical protein